jgi:predicted dinucleotide-utilizing enzyme
MNLVIVGCGTAGKNYINLLINKKKINKIYIIDNNQKIKLNNKCYLTN